MAGLIYYKLFSPNELDRVGEFQTKREVSETQLRIGSDHDGERERIVRVPLIPNPPDGLFQSNDDIPVHIRLGNALMPNKRDPLYIMISDGIQAAIGFKISEYGKIKGAEGVPERFLDLTRLSGDDNETASLNPHDYPDEFHITLKPEQYWGTIFCAQGNGTKQCVGYAGEKAKIKPGCLFRDVS